MSKKKKTSKTGNEFDNNPFRALKGFAVSAPPPEPAVAPPEEELKKPEAGEDASFDDEMGFLGVKPLADRDGIVGDEPKTPTSRPVAPAEPQSDEEVFLASLGELDVRFSDQLPDEVAPARARRMKQLRQGKLRPEAELDLHGIQRHEVADKLNHFLQNARHNDWQTLLVVTGRGLHSEDGTPVLREEVERILHSDRPDAVAEWERAPRQYGGEGALVLFLKKQQAGER